VITRVELASEEFPFPGLHHHDRLEVRLARAPIQRQAMMSMVGYLGWAPRSRSVPWCPNTSGRCAADAAVNARRLVSGAARPQGRRALALEVYVHPMAEGLVKAGAHLDQVVGG
jgi:hypothetical protein